MHVYYVKSSCKRKGARTCIDSFYNGRKQLKSGQASIVTHAVAARGSEAEPQKLKHFLQSAFLAQDYSKRATCMHFL